ncbi:MAG: PDZ domain-containing protein [Verrucomicrobiota bacterium]|nr:PDZ domain-containing protein [Verrucomicrobiota bacterium]
MARAFLLLVLVCALGDVAHAVAPVAASTEKHVPIVRVNVTNQPYDFFHPWTKRAPTSRHGLGAVLQSHRVLVTAELVENANYVELEAAESGEKMAATVDVVDYEANLALLKPNEEKFFAAIKPLETKNAVVGDRVGVWQLESTGALVTTTAVVTTVEVSRYPTGDSALLVYRLTSPLQYRESSFTLPVVKDDKLTGLLMRYDTRTQNVDVIPAPVIDHFLKDATSKGARGFPRAGVLFATTRDPQLRRYAGLNGNANGGVYVTHVQPGGPADKAGVQVGDIMLTIGGKAIDQDGNFSDPLYGKISLVHLITTTHFDGDVVKCDISRKGEVRSVSLTLKHRPVSDYVIEPYTIDSAPHFYVLGGLVFQELSRQYLKEWGSEWLKKAPERFVYYDRYQAELFLDRTRKLVILSQVLPSPITLGYEELNYLVVTKINGIEIKSLADIPGALEKAENGFHKIEFDENPHEIYLDASQVEASNAALMKNYGLPDIKRLD